MSTKAITYRVDFLGLVGNLSGFLALDIAFLELGKETTPILIGKGGVFGEFTLDHEFL